MWKERLLGNDVEPQNSVVGTGLQLTTSSDTGLTPKEAALSSIGVYL